MIIDGFNRITGLRIDRYLSDYRIFVTTMIPNIVNYYTGVSSKPDNNSFRMLDELIKQSVEIDGVIINSSRRFRNAEYWELIETLDNLKTSLETVYNTSKWVRSTIATGDLNPNMEVDAILEQQNTLEMLSSKSGYTDTDNSWTLVALRNDLDEDKYTIDGGNTLKVNMLGRNTIVINDVIDQTSEANMYGKDIKAVFEFVDDDLNTLSGLDCLLQSYSTLLQLSKGDIPEFPQMGVGVVVGGNMAVFSYPTILRQIHETFYTDSSVKSVAIGDLAINQDIVNMNVIIESKFGTFLKNTDI